MIEQGLVIDRDVRNWVLIPLTLSVMLLMLLRQYASVVSSLDCKYNGQQGCLPGVMSPELTKYKLILLDHHPHSAVAHGRQVSRASKSQRHP